MKNFLFAVLPVLLVACDKPDVEVLLKPCCEMGDKFGVVKLSVWDDGRAVLNVNETDVVLTQEEEDNEFSNALYNYIEWRGKLPNEENDFFVNAHYDVVKQAFEYFSVSDDKDSGYYTDVVIPARLSKYKKPTDTELCIGKIEEKTEAFDGKIFVSRQQKFFEYRGENASSWERTYFEKIPAEDAIAISENWDYKNLQIYSNADDKGVEAHEKDACKTLERLNDYIEKRGWDKPIIVYEDEIRCKKPQQVVYLGCDLFAHAQFEYLTLYVCEDGRHVLDVGSDYVQTISMSSENKFDGILYSGTYSGRDFYEVLFNPSADKWFARLSTNSGAYGECVVGRLASHEVCARQIANIARVGADGIIELDIRGMQKTTKNGRTIEHEFVPLTQEQALRVSENWDYNNLKLYSTGQESHELDACEVLRRLGDMKYRLRREKDEK